MSSYCKQDLGAGFLVQITFDSCYQANASKNQYVIFALVILITQSRDSCDYTEACKGPYKGTSILK